MSALRHGPSTWAVDALRERGVPRVHRWGREVDTRRLTPSRCDHQLRMSLAREGELLVGYVGRLAPEKQVERLEVLAGLPGIRLVVVGDGPSEGRLRETLAAVVALTDPDLRARFAAAARRSVLRRTCPPSATSRSPTTET